MMAWEWVGGSSVSKEIQISDSIPTSPGEYGEREYYEIQAPTWELRFSCDGMTAAEYASLETSVTPKGVLVSLQDSLGRTWTGKFRSLSGNLIPGSEYYEQVQLVLEG